MSGNRFGDGASGGEHPDPPDRRIGSGEDARGHGRPPRRRRPPFVGGGRDQGSNNSLAAFLVGVAVIAGLIGFTLNRVTTGKDGTPGTATPTASASAAADRLTGLTAEQVAIRLLGAGIPLHTTIVYDASSDPNQLLGKPGGYSSKIAFLDTRTGVNPAGVTSKDPVDQGGSIEVFADQAAASSRVQRLRTASASSQLLQESDFQQGGVVLRVSRYLAETDANGYRDALAALAAPAGAAPVGTVPLGTATAG